MAQEFIHIMKTKSVRSLGKTLRMARVEALSALNTINSAEAEQVVSSFARGLSFKPQISG
jgi:hypothetical protein